mmetsp:Transcript_46613/g.110827  ORF Transcript_46613/g.110827 Transcript_46613/m.110827 type:complete len:262 (+) Transcript_46613:441-1226(+)
MGSDLVLLEVGMSIAQRFQRRSIDRKVVCLVLIEEANNNAGLLINLSRQALKLPHQRAKESGLATAIHPKHAYARLRTDIQVELPDQWAGLVVADDHLPTLQQRSFKAQRSCGLQLQTHRLLLGFQGSLLHGREVGGIGELELVAVRPLQAHPVEGPGLVVQAQLGAAARHRLQQVVVVGLPAPLLHLLDLLLHLVLLFLLTLGQLRPVLLVFLMGLFKGGVVARVHLQLHLPKAQRHGAHLVQEVPVMGHHHQRHLAQLL